MITPELEKDEAGRMKDKVKTAAMKVAGETGWMKERRIAFTSSFILPASSFQKNLARRTHFLDGGPDNHQRG
jgi:hypothetical protein